MAIGAALLVLGCGEPEQVPEAVSQEKPLAGAGGWNGLAWNGLAWNGSAWNGLAWNGSAWNGLGWNGLAWNGIGWNGLAWNGSAWNGLAWNGSAWNGLAWNGISGQNSPTFTTLHDWLNHTDADGDGSLKGCLGGGQCSAAGCASTAWYECCSGGVSASGCTGTAPASNWKHWEYNTFTGWTFYDQCNNTKTMNETVDDLTARVDALGYWVSCACPDSVSIDFADTHNRLPARTFRGALGLAPTWCGTASSCSSTGCANVQVPTSEQQLVSACLMARVNTKGTHFPLSLATSTLPTTLDEMITHRQSEPSSVFFGNLWAPQNAWAWDGTTPASSDGGTSGGFWVNTQKFVCSYKTDTAALNLNVVGRNCEVDGCGHITDLGNCVAQRKRLNTTSSSPQYLWPQQPRGNEPVTAGGVNVIATNPGPHYRGLTYPLLFVMEPAIMDFESALLAAPATGPVWTQWMTGSPSSGQLATCALDDNGQYSCWNGKGDWSGIWGKVAGLDYYQTIQGVLTGNRANGVLAGDPNEPMTVGIRYSRGAGAGRLRVWLNNTTPMADGWTQVQGTGSSYSKVLFPSTGSFDDFSTAYVYPVYMQDTIYQSSGRVDQNGAVVSYDTARIKVQGDTYFQSDAPHLDMAYFFPGAPPPTADCTNAAGGCWLYAGWNKPVSVPQSGSFTFQTPPLPPGTYTFQLTNVTSDADLYVRALLPVSLSQKDCVSAGFGTANESCTINLSDKGGVINVMVYGYGAGNSTATLTSRN